MQFNLAMVYFQLNRFEDARAPLATALQRWPDLFQLNVLYGAVLLKLGEELPAYRALQHAHELNSSDSGAVDLLYEAAIALGRKNQDGQRYSDSLHYYTKAAKLRPAEAAWRKSMLSSASLLGPRRRKNPPTDWLETWARSRRIRLELSQNTLLQAPQKG
jgi:tetratricopeptide (TPR) repeat protein